MLAARQLFAEAVLLPLPILLDQRDEQSLTEAQRHLHGIGEALADIVRENDPVDDRLDVVQLVPPQPQRIVAAVLQDVAQIDDLPIHSGADEPVLLQAFENLPVITLFAANYGRADDESRAVGEVQQRIDNLRRAASGDRQTAHEIARLMP